MIFQGVFQGFIITFDSALEEYMFNFNEDIGIRSPDLKIVTKYIFDNQDVILQNTIKVYCDVCGRRFEKTVRRIFEQTDMRFKYVCSLCVKELKGKFIVEETVTGRIEG